MLIDSLKMAIGLGPTLQVDEDRNYDLFAILADVRNGEGCAGVRTGDGFVPISEPRGWGEVDVKEDDPYHSASWLLLSETLDYDYSQKTFKVGIFNEEPIRGAVTMVAAAWVLYRN